jgi:hypothetical protein
MSAEPTIYRQCPKCGNSPVSADLAKFCYRDGSRLVAKVAKCQCGNYIDFRHDTFCDQCGVAASQAIVKVTEE